MAAMRLPLALASLLHANAAVRAPSPADEVALLQAQVSKAQRPLELHSSEGRLQAAMESARSSGSSASGLNATDYVQPMINFGDAQYVSYVMMGKQMITGIIDTGSFELVVFGADCTSCSVAAHYNKRFSDSYQRGNLWTQQNYGSGGSHCMEGFEQVSIGPYPAAKQMFWEVVEAQMPILQNAAFESIIGVGPTEAMLLDAWAQADFMIKNLTSYYDQAMLAPRDTVLNSQQAVKIAIQLGNELPMLHTWNVPIFSICLGALPGADGMIVWNDTKPASSPELFWKVPVVGEWHRWSASMTEPSLVSANGTVTQLSGCEGGCEALIDSGTSLLAAPTPIIENISSAMQQLNADCSNLEVLPELSFKLGDVTFTLPPSAYVARLTGVASGWVQEKLPRREQDDLRQCRLMLMDTGNLMGQGNMWILGVPWFRKYYTSFELGDPTMDYRAFHISEHGEEACEPTMQKDVQLKAKRPRHHLREIQAERLHLPPRRGIKKVWRKD